MGRLLWLVGGGMWGNLVCAAIACVVQGEVDDAFVITTHVGDSTQQSLPVIALGAVCTQRQRVPTLGESAAAVIVQHQLDSSLLPKAVSRQIPAWAERAAIVRGQDERCKRSQAFEQHFFQEGSGKMYSVYMLYGRNGQMIFPLSFFPAGVHMSSQTSLFLHIIRQLTCLALCATPYTHEVVFQAVEKALHGYAQDHIGSLMRLASLQCALLCPSSSHAPAKQQTGLLVNMQHDGVLLRLQDIELVPFPLTDKKRLCTFTIGQPGGNIRSMYPERTRQSGLNLDVKLDYLYAKQELLHKKVTRESVAKGMLKLRFDMHDLINIKGRLTVLAQALHWPKENQLVHMRPTLDRALELVGSMSD